MNKPAVFLFHVPFNNVSAVVDRDQGVIRGVAVITGGVTAKGHNLEVDDKTLDQIVKCGKKKGKVQVKLNHKDPQALQSICGYLKNFRREFNKVLADWHLLKSHEEYEKTLEKAEVMPDCFGLSAAFSGPPEGEELPGGKRGARCEELLAVDCVPMPAANPDGLFSALVDMPAENQMPDPNTPAKEPTLAEVLTAVQGLGTRIEEIATRQDEMAAELEGNQPLSQDELEALLAETDDQLAERGISRDQVQATLDAVYGEPAAGDTDADRAAAAGNGTANAPAATTAATAALSALRSRIVQLEQKLGQDAATQEFAEITQAFDVLEEKYDKAIELVAAKDAQIVSLQRALKLHGTKAASASTESTRMFSAEDGGAEKTEFETEVAAKTIELEKGGKTPTAAKAEAIRFVVKHNPRAFAAHRAANGSVQLADE